MPGSDKLGTKADSMPTLVVESGGESPTESKQSMWAGRRPNRPTRYVGLIENNVEKKKVRCPNVNRNSSIIEHD